MVQGLGRCASATGAQAHSWSGKEDPASHSAQPKTNKHMERDSDEIPLRGSRKSYRPATVMGRFKSFEAFPSLLILFSTGNNVNSYIHGPAAVV